MRPWEADELGQFLDHVQGDRLGPLFEVAAYTGLRRGELVGLRWDDIDLVRGVIIVRQQVVEIDGSGVVCPFCGGEHRAYRFGPPKTASGEARRVDLDHGTVGVLLGQQLAQQGERDAWADAYSDHGLVFAREDGSPIPPSDVTAAFYRLTDAAGLRRVRLHDLRHGQASLMLAAGVPIAVVSKRLGHSSISITSDTYSHLLEGVGQQAAEAAAGLVPRTKKAPESTSEAEGNQSATTRPNPNLAKLPSRAARAGQRGGAGGARTHDQRIMRAYVKPLSEIRHQP
ncbi:site-specific tyrosine recombinase XerC [Tsukamurella pulmonis]|nr:site-specific tyrosine recombinase XerC [Tsukamurella pulmonis]